MAAGTLEIRAMTMTQLSELEIMVDFSHWIQLGSEEENFMSSIIAVLMITGFVAVVMFIIAALGVNSRPAEDDRKRNPRLRPAGARTALSEQQQGRPRKIFARQIRRRSSPVSASQRPGASKTRDSTLVRDDLTAPLTEPILRGWLLAKGHHRSNRYQHLERCRKPWSPC